MFNTMTDCNASQAEQKYELSFISQYLSGLSEDKDVLHNIHEAIV